MKRQDPDQDQFIFSLVNNAPFCYVDPVSGVVEWFPNRHSAKRQTLIFSVSDGDYVVYDTFKVYFVNTVAVEPNAVRDPRTYFLGQNHPNPFNQSTSVSSNLPETAFVEFAVYNYLGELIRKPATRNQTSGNYTIVWDGCDQNSTLVASGIFLHLKGRRIFHEKEDALTTIR